MKLQSFPGCSGAAVGSEQIIIAEDGTCEVSPETAAVLCDTHGFTVYGKKVVAPEDKPPEDKFDAMSRAECISYIKAKGFPVVPNTGNEELRAFARTQYSPQERAADAAAISKSKG
jgi:hypothetical protein